MGMAEQQEAALRTAKVMVTDQEMRSRHGRDEPGHVEQEAFASVGGRAGTSLCASLLCTAVLRYCHSYIPRYLCTPMACPLIISVLVSTCSRFTCTC